MTTTRTCLQSSAKFVLDTRENSSPQCALRALWSSLERPRKACEVGWSSLHHTEPSAMWHKTARDGKEPMRGSRMWERQVIIEATWLDVTHFLPMHVREGLAHHRYTKRTVMGNWKFGSESERTTGTNYANTCFMTTAEMDPKAKNTEHFTSISSLIPFVFTCKGTHLTDSTEKFGNL